MRFNIISSAQKSIWLLCFFPLLLSCKKTPAPNPTPEPPGTSVLTTTIPSNVLSTSITIGGKYNSPDGEIIESGVCYSKQESPTTADSKVINPLPGARIFDLKINNLSPGTTYHIRAYAITNYGTSYGNDVAVATLPVGIAIGAIYQGGMIFYIDNTGKHGLIVAPADQSRGEATWGCADIYIREAENGSGQVNTKAILDKCKTPGIAAALCDNLVIGTYDDWYLPSIDELDLVHGLFATGKAASIGLDENAIYWSSSQMSVTLKIGGGNQGQYAYVYKMNKSSLIESSTLKSSTNAAFVRAIRSF